MRERIKFETEKRSLPSRLVWSLIGVVLIFLTSSSITLCLAQSVEKAETTQQAKEPADQLELAREAVSHPTEKQKPTVPGHIMGDYIINSSLEMGYRTV